MLVRFEEGGRKEGGIELTWWSERDRLSFFRDLHPTLLSRPPPSPNPPRSPTGLRVPSRAKHSTKPNQIGSALSVFPPSSLDDAASTHRIVKPSRDRHGVAGMERVADGRVVDDDGFVYGSTELGEVCTNQRRKVSEGEGEGEKGEGKERRDEPLM